MYVYYIHFSAHSQNCQQRFRDVFAWQAGRSGARSAMGLALRPRFGTVLAPRVTDLPGAFVLHIPLCLTVLFLLNDVEHRSVHGDAFHVWQVLLSKAKNLLQEGAKERTATSVPTGSRAWIKEVCGGYVWCKKSDGWSSSGYCSSNC